MDKNIYKMIGDLNQSSNYKYKYRCPVFSFAHNVYFNTGIGFDYKDMEKMAQLCKDKGLLSDEKGGYAKCFEVCFDYAKTLNLTPKIRLIKTTSGTATYEQLIHNDYILRVGLGITKEGLKDIRDNGIIDTIDYSKIKGKDFEHFLNIGPIKTNQYNGEYMIDNYFGKHKSVIKCSLKEMEKLIYPSVYAVIPL